MPKDFVGMQIGAISFVDEGVEPVLDWLQEKCGVNALCISALTWSRGNAGRATEGYPDHGPAEPDYLKGGAMYKIHPQYYVGSPVPRFEAPDPLYKGFDTLGDVIPAARARGMKVYPYYCETAQSSVRHIWQPGWHNFLDVDHRGRVATRPSLMNPAYQSWWHSVLDDWFNSYTLDGLLWGIERQSPLMDLLGGDTTTGFDRYFQEEAARRGIDTQRAIQGYRKVEEWLADVRKGAKPRDGFFISFLRVLLHHPEVFQWEKMWLDAHENFYYGIAGMVKFISPKLEMGYGIWQVINTFNPYLRAQYDAADLQRYADWLKPVLYDVPAGVRFARFARGWQQTILKDASPEAVVDGMATLLGLDIAPLAELPMAGFSPDYIRQKTAELIEATGGKVKVYPGIGLGAPSGPGGKAISPKDARDAVVAAYEGGAHGVLISRNYSEANLRDMAAVGDALKELGRW
ncbi:MAG: hypothetical protein KIT87_05405 [Anaerolineae bacterium]|nr:hypothetical protein [Anaerolineae bacterium]